MNYRRYLTALCKSSMKAVGLRSKALSIFVLVEAPFAFETEACCSVMMCIVRLLGHNIHIIKLFMLIQML